MSKRLPNGNLLVPFLAEYSEDGLNVRGDAWFEIGPDHPHYAAYDRFLKMKEEAGLPSE